MMTRQLHCLVWQDQKRAGMFYSEKRDFYIVPQLQRAVTFSDTNYPCSEKNTWSQTHWTKLQLLHVHGGADVALSPCECEVAFSSTTSSVQYSSHSFLLIIAHYFFEQFSSPDDPWAWKSSEPTAPKTRLTPPADTEEPKQKGEWSNLLIHPLQQCTQGLDLKPTKHAINTRMCSNLIDEPAQISSPGLWSECRLINNK